MYNVNCNMWHEYPRTTLGFCKAIKNRRLEDKISQHFKSTDYIDTLILFHFNRFRQIYLFTEAYLKSTGVKYFDVTIRSVETYIKEMNKTLHVYNEVINDLTELDDLTDTTNLTKFIIDACKLQRDNMILVASIKYNVELTYEKGELLWHTN